MAMKSDVRMLRVTVTNNTDSEQTFALFVCAPNLDPPSSIIKVRHLPIASTTIHTGATSSFIIPSIPEASAVQITPSPARGGDRNNNNDGVGVGLSVTSIHNVKVPADRDGEMMMAPVIKFTPTPTFGFGEIGSPSSPTTHRDSPGWAAATTTTASCGSGRFRIITPSYTPDDLSRSSLVGIGFTVDGRPRFGAGWHADPNTHVDVEPVLKYYVTTSLSTSNLDAALAGLRFVDMDEIANKAEFDFTRLVGAEGSGATELKATLQSDGQWSDTVVTA